MRPTGALRSPRVQTASCRRASPGQVWLPARCSRLSCMTTSPRRPCIAPCICFVDQQHQKCVNTSVRFIKQQQQWQQLPRAAFIPANAFTILSCTHSDMWHTWPHLRFSACDTITFFFSCSSFLVYRACIFLLSSPASPVHCHGSCSWW